MTEYYDGLRVEKEKNPAVPRDETGDELSISELQVLAERAYPNDKPSACSRHQRRSVHCTVCYPDIWGLVGTHNELKQKAWRDVDALLAILREALKEIDDNPERYEVHAFCNECAEGNRPLRYEYRLCWIHKARKLIGDAK